MNTFMKLAIAEAFLGIEQNHGGPFGAVIVKDNQVIASSHNKVILKNDPTAHGEMEAIREASKYLGTFDLSGCEIYTTGYPCPMCFGAILWANISKIYYGCNILDTENIGFRDNKFEQNKEEFKNQMCVEIDRAECLKLYQTYLDLTNKTNY